MCASIFMNELLLYTMAHPKVKILDLVRILAHETRGWNYTGRGYLNIRSNANSEGLQRIHEINNSCFFVFYGCLFVRLSLVCQKHSRNGARGVTKDERKLTVIIRPSDYHNRKKARLFHEHSQGQRRPKGRF